MPSLQCVTLLPHRIRQAWLKQSYQTQRTKLSDSCLLMHLWTVDPPIFFPSLNLTNLN